MKKTYIEPNMVVLHIESQLLDNISFDGNGRGSINTQDDDAVSAGMSRGGSWDDED